MARLDKNVDKTQISGLLILCKFGSYIGLLPLKYNPSFKKFEDGPFETSKLLFLYSLFVWISCNLTFAYIYLVEGREIFKFPSRFNAVRLNIDFILCLLFSRHSIRRILNSVLELVHNCRKTDLTFSHIEFLLPYLPFFIYLTKLAIENNFIVEGSLFYILNTISILCTICYNGLIYTWLLSGEKVLVDINNQIKCNSLRLSIADIQRLMSKFLDVVDFVSFLSKSMGVTYLMKTMHVMVYDMSDPRSVLPEFKGFGLDLILSIVYFLEFHLDLYMFLINCYWSQCINKECQNLKWTLGSLQAYNRLPTDVLKAVYLFEKKIDIKTTYFSAFHTINFDFHLILLALNKTITYLFAISTIESPQ